MPLALPLFGWRNLIDDAVLSAGSQVATLPVGNLKTADLGQVWRSTTGTALLADLGSQQSVGFTALMRTNFETASDIRVRVSTSDATGAEGDAYDSGNIETGVDLAYDGLWVHFFGPVTGRYIRIDPADSRPEAGRWAAGPTWRPPVSYAFNWRLMWRDHSRSSFSEGMSRWVDRRARQRGWALTFRGLTHTDAFAQLQDICRVIGTGGDFLLCRDPGSLNLSRETMWGSVESVPELEQITPDHFETDIEMWARIS